MGFKTPGEVTKLLSDTVPDSDLSYLLILRINLAGRDRELWTEFGRIENT